MMNKEKTLFIFEGVKTESKLIEKLEHNFLGKTNSIKCVFDAEIYQLYRAIKEEKEFSIDIVSLLKERTAENAKILENYTRDSFAYIYLFFDYDAHSTLADDNKIKEMLSLFNDETEEGMLYISYPMVEAIRHFKDLESFKSLTVKCKRKNCPYKEECHNKEECLKEPHYKSVAASDSRPQLSNVNSYTKTVWQGLLGINDTWYKRRFGEITDFNEANNTGYMFVDKTQSLDNKPNTSSNYGFLETIAINEVTIKQTFVDFQSRFFIRICNNGTWTDWKQIQTTKS